MKTAISIPDDVFQKAERLAKRMRKSRSQLYSEAVAEYTARHSEDDITESYNALADEVSDEDMAFIRAAGRLLLDKVEWT